MRWLGYLQAACLLTIPITQADHVASQDSMEVSDDASHRTLMFEDVDPKEIHQVFLTVQDIAAQQESQRHKDEKVKLLRRMSRDVGKWDVHHPRHRLLDALYGFSRYYETHSKETARLKKLYKNVSKSQKKLLESAVGYSQKFTKVDHVLAQNHRLCQEIVDAALAYYEVDPAELHEHIKKAEKDGKKPERVSVAQGLKHLVRDWSEEGLSERGEAFPCLLKTINGLFPGREEPIRVLFPGAGLGRLGHDVAALGGFEVTNNEWSMYMNAITRFLETQTTPSNAVYAFADYWSHHASTADMLRGVPFPDTPPAPNKVLHVEGDFTTVFAERTGYYDSIITHYFIDTARNLMSYFDIIHRLLKPGGYWVNFGPLMYGSAPFVQLSLEEIIIVVEAMGFEFLKTDGEGCGEITIGGREVRGLRSVYGFNERALTRNAYNAQFWVVRKK